MKSSRLTLLAISILLYTVSISPVYSADSILEPVNTSKFDQLLVASEIKLSSSRKIYVEDASVAFAERWLKSHGRDTSNHYQEEIIEQYAKGLKKELIKALNKAGWEVVTSSDTVISLKPRIYDLYILAPDSPGLKQVLVSYVGGAGVELIFQSQHNQTFMKIVDYAKTQDSGSSAVTANRMNNYHYFKMLMSDWSSNSVAYLEEIMTVVNAQVR